MDVKSLKSDSQTVKRGLKEDVIPYEVIAQYFINIKYGTIRINRSIRSKGFYGFFNQCFI